MPADQRRNDVLNYAMAAPTSLRSLTSYGIIIIIIMMIDGIIITMIEEFVVRYFVDVHIRHSWYWMR